MKPSSCHLQKSMQSLFLGLLDFHNSKYNFVIFYAKYYIYKCKWDHNYKTFVKTLKTCKDIENVIAVKNNRVEIWNNRWKNVKV